MTETETTNYVYDREDIVLEIFTTSSGTEKTCFTNGLGIDEHLAMERNGQFYFYHSNGLGSVTHITNATKTVVQSYQYESFGMPRPSTDFRNSFTYLGKEYDWETGLIRMGVRYYDQMEGRFVSNDPISFAGGDVNLYGYTSNNPINYTDPSGTFINFIAAGAGAAVGATVGAINAIVTHSSVTKGVISGAIVGATAGLTFGTSILANSVAGAIIATAGDYLAQKWANPGTKVDTTSLAINGIAGALSAGIGSGMVKGGASAIDAALWGGSIGGGVATGLTIDGTNISGNPSLTLRLQPCK